MSDKIINAGGAWLYSYLSFCMCNYSLVGFRVHEKHGGLSMTYHNYVLYLQGTIGTYPSKVNKHLQKLFIGKGIAQGYT